MRQRTRIAAAAAIACALFVAGGVGLFHSLRTERPYDSSQATVRSDALLAPVVTGSLNEIITSLQQRLRALPTDWRSFASLGLAYVQEARVTADPSYYPKAQGVLQQSLKLDAADNFQAMVGMASLAAARHDFSGALNWGEKAKAINPYNGNVYGVIGDAQVELGRYDDAFTTFQKMVDTLPSTASYARVSYARELMGDVPGAIGAMKQALSFAGTPPDQAWASFQLGELYFNSGRLDKAATAYRRGTEYDPTYIPARAGLAKVSWARGDVQRAIAGYTDVVAKYPSPEYVIALGDLYRVDGQPDQAARQYALLHVEERLFLSAGVNLDLEFALFRAAHGDPHGALRAARQEWHRRHSILVADGYAWALYANGDYREAALYERRAMALGYRSALFDFHAGMIQLKLGNPEAAKRYLQKAVSTNPNFSILYAPTARRELARLGGGA